MESLLTSKGVKSNWAEANVIVILTVSFPFQASRRRILGIGKCGWQARLERVEWAELTFLVLFLVPDGRLSRGGIKWTQNRRFSSVTPMNRKTGT